jgi:hypothetical protein
MKRAIALWVCAAAAIAGVVAVTPVTAKADTGHIVGTVHASTLGATDAQASTRHRVYFEMHSVGFDAGVAAAHGYEIRTSPDGKQYSVPKGSPSGAVSPFNNVTGNCGESWVFEDGIGNASVSLDTGYAVYTAVVARQWRVVLDDNGGESTQNFSGGGTGAYSAWIKTIRGLTRGPGFAFVRSDGSNFAILKDGNVCFSGGPSDSTTIY